MNSRRCPELLVPASCLEVLKIAVIYGADAVYIGGEAFGLRAKAKNFSPEDMEEGIRFAHARGVKVYVTANILAHNRDLEGVRKYFRAVRSMKPDGLSSPIRESFGLRGRSVRRFRAISAPRPIIQTMRHTGSGTSWGRGEWFPPEN